MLTASTLAGPISYERRRPEQTLLYKVIQENLQAFLNQVHAKGDRFPDFVKEEFLAFLDCGILAKGFLRLQCEGCHHEMLVAFSCKKRGFCPSCGTKRMIETSALLMDHVIPNVAVRQWVLSFPFALRYLLVSDPKIMGKILKIQQRKLHEATLTGPRRTLWGVGSVFWRRRYRDVDMPH